MYILNRCRQSKNEAFKGYGKLHAIILLEMACRSVNIGKLAVHAMADAGREMKGGRTFL